MATPRRPRQRRLLRAALTVAGASFLLAGAAAPGTALPRTALPVTGNERLTADVLTATGLVYDGLRTVTTSGGSADVLRFSLAGGTASGLLLESACVAGHTLVQQASGDTTLGATILQVFSLTATVGGTTVTFTPSSPPTSAFPSPVELDQVDTEASTISSAQVTVSGAAISVGSC